MWQLSRLSVNSSRYRIPYPSRPSRSQRARRKRRQAKTDGLTHRFLIRWLVGDSQKTRLSERPLLAVSSRSQIRRRVVSHQNSYGRFRLLAAVRQTKSCISERQQPANSRHSDNRVFWEAQPTGPPDETSVSIRLAWLMSDVRLYPDGTSIGYPAAFQLRNPSRKK